MGVDEAGTEALREQMRSERGPLAMFDRGPGFEMFKEEGRIRWPEGWVDLDGDPAALERAVR